MLKPLICLFFFQYAFLAPGFAQQTTFIPAIEDAAFLKTNAERAEQIYRQELAALPPKNKADFEKIYKQRWENIRDKFDHKEIYTSAPAQSYLNALVDEIARANPLLKERLFTCYFSRSGIPNASYLGEGIILFNMGLFQRLDNESQAAFIICHEIAHFLLKHSENAMGKYVATVNSEEVQKELSAIKGSEYRKREQLEKLVKGLSFNTLRHSRDHESEADSMAVELLHHTRFDVTGALSTLTLLDAIDTDTLNTVSCLEKMFNTPGYPFQKRWVAKEEGLLGGHAVLKEDAQLADSLKTHPDCKLRIKLLEPMVNRYYQPSMLKDAVDKNRFEELKNIFAYEIIEYNFSSGNYSRSFIYTIELLQKKPSDPYLVAQVGKILNGMYAAQKTHTLGKLVSLPSPAYPANYNILLQFVQNLYLENFASLSYHFLKQYDPQLSYYEPFKNAYATSIQIAQR